jgi:Ca2+-binding EF-hand superfamily protein
VEKKKLEKLSAADQALKVRPHTPYTDTVHHAVLMPFSCCTYSVNSVLTHHARTLKAVFDHYDADGSGEVTREEMLEYMTQLLMRKSAGKVAEEEVLKRAKVAADK